MDDIDGIEDSYSRNLDELDKEFLEKSKNLKDKSSLEKEFNKKLKNTKEKYEKNVSSFLKTHEPFDAEDESSKKKEESKDESDINMLKPFAPKGAEIDLKSDESLGERWQGVKFKENIKMKKFFGAIIPEPIKLSLIRVKYFIKRLALSMKNHISNFFSALISGFSSILESFKNLVKRIAGLFKKALSFIVGLWKKIFKKKKSKDNEAANDAIASSAESAEEGDKSGTDSGKDAESEKNESEESLPDSISADKLSENEQTANQKKEVGAPTKTEIPVKGETNYSGNADATVSHGTKADRQKSGKKKLKSTSRRPVKNRSKSGIRTKKGKKSSKK